MPPGRGKEVQPSLTANRAPKSLHASSSSSCLKFPNNTLAGKGEGQHACVAPR